jgi:penicillin-binding protein 2
MKTEYPDVQAHGAQDLVSALADSCNVYFYQLGGGEVNGRWQGLGPERLANLARMLGLGQITGIDLPGEMPGLIPSPDWKQETYKEDWTASDTYSMAIGQGSLAVTPLQMANAVAAIANGGTLYRPQLVLEVLDSEGQVVKPYTAQVIRKLPVDSQTLEPVRLGMQASMLRGKSPYGTTYVGTSSASVLNGVDVAGKAGTGEHGPADAQGNLINHGWFIAFAPAEDPRIAIAVFVERGKGADDAAKAGMDILSSYFGAETQAGLPGEEVKEGGSRVPHVQ